ncbi:MAG: UbiA family prenyltransferase, partial [Alphaproteobacteria bacterium]|nr:UbiA family prenyltransferase [Alphaproteobacteria bacterium]
MPQTANDINLDHPLVRFLPRNWLPFAALIRLDRPIGTYLAFLPALMGLNLAMQYVPYDQRHFNDWLFWSAIFLFGAWTMRSVGCIWNDWLDRDFDSQVLRTQHRPIASGQVTSRAAFWLMAGLLG